MKYGQEHALIHLSAHSLYFVRFGVSEGKGKEARLHKHIPIHTNTQTHQTVMHHKLYRWNINFLVACLKIG